MKTLKNKKGIELALNTVVVLAVLLIVLIVIVSFFLGGTRQVFGPIANWLTGAGEELELSHCFSEGETTCGSSACASTGAGCILECSGGEWRVREECTAGCEVDAGLAHCLT